MNDDMELVREYATRQSEPAFETLVTRYVSLVYATAMRRVGEVHLAEEITQAVFILLARKAGSLGPNTIVPSWLHRTAGFAASDALKSQRRRRQRESEAQMQTAINAPENEEWLRLAAVISAAALSGSALTTSTVLAATTKTVALTALQKTLVAVAFAVVALAGLHEARQAAHLRAQVRTLQQSQAPLTGQILQLQADLADATNRLAGLRDELAGANQNNLELLKLRASPARFNTATVVEKDPAFQKARQWLAKVARLREQFDLHPDQWIPEMQYFSDEEWLDQARRSDLESASGIRCAMSNVRVAATFDFAQNISAALMKYLIAHQQQLPESTSQLSPYFKSSITDAGTILARYEMLNPEAQTNSADAGISIIEKSVVDPIDSPVLIGVNTVKSRSLPTWPNVIPNELEPVVDAYRAANHQEGFLSIYDLEPYAVTSEQKAALTKFIHSSDSTQ